MSRSASQNSQPGWKNGLFDLFGNWSVLGSVCCFPSIVAGKNIEGVGEKQRVLN